MDVSIIKTLNSAWCAYFGLAEVIRRSDLELIFYWN